MKFFCRLFLFSMTLFVSSTLFAAVINWQILPAESSLTFTATQNNAPVTGKFKNFGGEIYFDPANLKASHLRMVVDMNSVITDYEDVANTLKTAEWFNVTVFPEAIFKATDFSKTGENSYQAKGTLTIRDKAMPIVLDFTMLEYSPTKAHAKGSVTLKRLSFDVGQGEWAKADEVKDDVKVQFDIITKSKNK